MELKIGGQLFLTPSKKQKQRVIKTWNVDTYKTRIAEVQKALKFAHGYKRIVNGKMTMAFICGVNRAHLKSLVRENS